jgi:hypothetical protein
MERHEQNRTEKQTTMLFSAVNPWLTPELCSDGGDDLRHGLHCTRSSTICNLHQTDPHPAHHPLQLAESCQPPSPTIISNSITPLPSPITRQGLRGMRESPILRRTSCCSLLRTCHVDQLWSRRDFLLAVRVGRQFERRERSAHAKRRQVQRTSFCSKPPRIFPSQINTQPGGIDHRDGSPIVSTAPEAGRGCVEKQIPQHALLV